MSTLPVLVAAATMFGRREDVGGEANAVNASDAVSAHCGGNWAISAPSEVEKGDDGCGDGEGAVDAGESAVADTTATANEDSGRCTKAMCGPIATQSARTEGTHAEDASGHRDCSASARGPAIAGGTRSSTANLAMGIASHDRIVIRPSQWRAMGAADAATAAETIGDGGDHTARSDARSEPSDEKWTAATRTAGAAVSSESDGWWLSAAAAAAAAAAVGGDLQSMATITALRAREHHKNSKFPPKDVSIGSWVDEAYTVPPAFQQCARESAVSVTATAHRSHDETATTAASWLSESHPKTGIMS